VPVRGVAEVKLPDLTGKGRLEVRTLASA
jgi:hypothetical protein